MRGTLEALFGDWCRGENAAYRLEVQSVAQEADGGLAIALDWADSVSQNDIQEAREAILSASGLPSLQLIMQGEAGASEDAPPLTDADIPPEEAEPLDFEAERQAILEQMAREMAANPPPPRPKANPSTQERKPFERKNEKKYAVGKEEKLIYGKPVDRPILQVSQLHGDSGKVAVDGEIFASDLRALNGKDTSILSVDLYDGTGSVRATKFLDHEEAQLLQQELKEGTRVVIQGRVEYSDFEKSLFINPTAIYAKPKKVVIDNAATPRVELHLHTKMSAMDGICGTAEAIAYAARMGHKAIAITDHGVAQAFPDAMAAAKDMAKEGKPIKVIYGIEAYCVNDVKKSAAVKGYTDNLLEDEIIVFDLETTGLKAREHEIIEIAGVRMRRGEVLEQFQSYVKPNYLIPPDITKLTGINNETVSDAPSIEEALPRFLDFCGDRPMVAHNAGFDIGFLQANCERLGIEKTFCSVDTVDLARTLLPELPKHRLNNLADFYGLSLNHHRALDDTLALAKIYVRLLERLTSKAEVSRINEINDALERIKGGSGQVKGQKTWHTIILAKNREGLIDLYKLISEAHLEHYYRHPIIPMSHLAAVRENLIIGSACEAGELFSAVADDRPWAELNNIAKFYDFLEIQPIGNNRFMIEKGKARDEAHLQEMNKTIVKLGGGLGKLVCATGDVHFIRPGDAIFREIIMRGLGFGDAGNQPPLYYRTTDEMLREFDYLGTKTAYSVVVKNPNAIADLCEELQPVLDGTYPPSIENSAQELEDMVRRKADALYGIDGVLPEIVSARLESELTPIINNGFDVMYIIAQKLVSKSMENGYLVGSRGSVGSSIVAYFAGITEVNAMQPHYLCKSCHYSEFHEGSEYLTGIDLPDKICPKCGQPLGKDGFNIPFATFLGFDADKAPDIDLNFSGEYQAQAHRETIELFGEGQVFKAGTISAVKDRTAYGFVKKYLEETGQSVTRAEEGRLIKGCTGIKRTTGQHPGGLIVVPQGRSIYEFCPVQHPADDTDSDIITTHFDYHSIHDNLLKLDLLGHDDPTMIRRLYDLTGIDPTTVPLDDPETMSIFTDIKALGIETDDVLEETGAAIIPEFGTKFVRGMLMETRPTTFDGLVRISGLSHGTNVWRNNAQDIIRAGLGTLRDVISVRDDITVFLIEKGLVPKLAFTISESVRKGRGLKPEWEEEMQNHGLPQWYIDSCNTIEYMFPRAHAAAYVMMAFRIAWFKVHRPLEFYCAYFSVRAPGFDAAAMVFGDGLVCEKYRELKAQAKRSATENDVMITLEACHEFYKRGYSFAPIDIYRSDAVNFIIDGNTLIPPFSAIAGVGDAAARGIVAAREKGPFSSVEDMLKRCEKLSKTAVETLDQMGALKGIPLTDQISLFDML